MIQFNLLPDVKIKYIKTQRTKRIVMLSSLAVSLVSVLLVALLYLSVQVVQKKSLNDLSKDIVKETKQLQNVQDLDKILTIQNQLASLPGLHDGKPVSSRLLGYLIQVTPATASVSSVDVDFATNIIIINGSADSSATINKFADTLKFATYKTETKTDGKPFSDVVTSIGVSPNNAATKATFLLTFTYDPILFSNIENPVLVVPKITSTRSETEKPSAIFKESTIPTPKQGSN